LASEEELSYVYKNKMPLALGLILLESHGFPELPLPSPGWYQVKEGLV